MSWLRVGTLVTLGLLGALAAGCSDDDGAGEKPVPICTENGGTCYCDRAFEPDMPNRVEACVTHDCCGSNEAGDICYCWDSAYLQGTGETCDEHVDGSSFSRRVDNCPG